MLIIHCKNCFPHKTLKSISRFICSLIKESRSGSVINNSSFSTDCMIALSEFIIVCCCICKSIIRLAKSPSKSSTIEITSSNVNSIDKARKSFSFEKVRTCADCGVSIAETEYWPYI